MATLDSLQDSVKQLTDTMNDSMKSLREEMAGLKGTVATVETNMDTKIEGLRTLVNDEVKALREDIKTEVKTKVDERITGISTEVDSLRKKLAKAEGELDRIAALVDIPFHLDRSIVIYGLPNDEGVSDSETVDNLLETILGLEIEPRRIERMKVRNPDKPGVLKVELYDVDDKVEILRAKRKVDEHKKYANVSIKNCESHVERANRFNCKLRLSKFPDGDSYTITGHGLIKAKAELTKRDGNKGERATTTTKL